MRSDSRTESESEEQPATKAPHTRDFEITAKDLGKHGYTAVGCSRCDYMRVHGNGRGCSQAHSQACRTRILECLNETEEGRARASEFRSRRMKRDESLTEPLAPVITTTKTAELPIT